MHTSSQDDALLEKWRERTAREKAKVITAFLNEYGEHAYWEGWGVFLRKRQANGFEWTQSVDLFEIIVVAKVLKETPLMWQKQRAIQP